MNLGAIKSRGGYAFFGNFSVFFLSLFVALLPQHALASSLTTQFDQYIKNICFNIYALGAPTIEIATMCGLTATGSASAGGAGGPVVSANPGSATLRKKNGIHDLQNDQNNKPEKGASADGGGWGFLLTPQYANSNRTETDLENGYESNLRGLVAGLDYRFSDSFILGATIGQTKDSATFLNGAGSLNTSNNTYTVYGIWLPSVNTAVDGYLGRGKLNIDSVRKVVWSTTISGTTNGSTNGQQTMAGISASYHKDIGRLNLSPFISLDYIKTTFNSYDETGTTTLEMHYGNRSTISFTSTLGARVNSTYGYEWGTLQPSARLATVHEFQNNAQKINNALVITPGINFSVETDSPDRNYLNIGLGVSAALNNGAQLFLDYDKRAQDRLLSSWAVSAGVLVGF